MDVEQSARKISALFPVLFILAFAAVTWPAFMDLANRWSKLDESFSHGFLLLAITIVLGVRTWLRYRPVVGFYWGWLPLFFAPLLLYLGGSILMIETFQQLALVPILLGGLIVMWGWKQTLPFIVPVGLLIFAMPFWEYLSWPLQVITVTFNELMLTPLDIDFNVEGVFVYFPGVGAFEIANGCSGLRYLLVGMTLVLLYGELNFRALSSRIWLLLAAIALALLANWIRVFIIIYVGYESNMESSLIKDHDMFGWWVFAATLVPLFFIARMLEKKEDKRGIPEDQPEDRSAAEASGPRATLGLVSAVVPVLAIGILVWVSAPDLEAGTGTGTGSHDVTLVDEGQWLPLFQRKLAGWQPQIERPDVALEQTYRERGSVSEGQAKAKELFVGLYSYDYQRPGMEVVQYANRLFPGDYLIPERTFAIEAGGGTEMSGLVLRYRQSEQRIMLAYGYYVEGRWEDTELRAKLAQLPGIFNARSDASLLVVGLSCGTCNSEQDLAALARSARAQAERYLDDFYQ